MAWDNSNRRNELPPNWQQIRQATAIRAGGQCEWITNGQRCPAPGTDCDHYGDKHDHTKTRWLCPPHHRLHTQEQSKTARRRIAERGRRAIEPHPGLIA